MKFVRLLSACLSAMMAAAFWVGGTVGLGITSVELRAQGLIQLTLHTEPAECGNPSGSIAVSALGGQPPYTYMWSNGSATPVINSLPPGTYTITVSDQLSNTAVATSVVTEQNNFEVTHTVVYDNCLPNSTATVAVQAIGSSGYQYSWNVGGNGAQLSAVQPGVYRVTVTDALGCQQSVNITVPTPTPLTVNIRRNCLNGVALEAVPVGGVPPYDYQWNNGNSGAVLQNLVSETYRVTVTDARNCTAEATESVNAVNRRLYCTVTDNICFNERRGAITVDSVVGGFPPFLYSLNDGPQQGSATFQALPTGAYRVQVHDSYDCPIVANVVVNSQPPFMVDAYPNASINIGDSVRLYTRVIPARPGVRLEWSPTEGLECADCPEPSARPASSTTYTVTATDPQGCRVRDGVYVEVRKQREVFIPTVFTPNADGLNDFFVVYVGWGVKTIRSVTIANRWGEPVFQSLSTQPNNLRQGWDGTQGGRPAPSGVYLYHIEVEFFDGYVQPYTGTVLLQR